MGLIYLDSCLLIYAIEQDPVFGKRTLAALTKVPTALLAISPLVKLECLVKPMREGNLVLQQHYELALQQLTLLDMPDAVYQRATRLRAIAGIKTPDALHLACAQHHGCEAIWTNDDRLTKAGHGLARNILA